MQDLLIKFAMYQHGVIKSAGKLDDVKRQQIVDAVKKKLNIPLSYEHLVVDGKTKKSTKTAASIKTLSPTTKVNKDNFVDMLNAVGEHVSDNKEVFDSHDKKIKEVKQESKNTNKAMDLLNKIVDIVSVLVNLDKNKTASIYDFNNYIKIANVIVAEDDESWGDGAEWTPESWKKYKKQHPNTKIKPKFKKKEKEEKEEKDDDENETKKQEIIDKNKKVFEEEKPSWFEEGIDPSDDEGMKKRGFSKKTSDLADDTNLVDVTTGKRYKYSDLPKDIKKQLEEMNSSSGLWHTPNNGDSENDNEQKPKDEIEEELLKEEDELENKTEKQEIKQEEKSPEKEEKSPEKEEKSPEKEEKSKEIGKEQVDALKEVNEEKDNKEVETQSKPKKRMKVDTELHAFLTNMTGSRKDLIDPLEKLNNLPQDKQEEVWYEWFGNSGKNIDLTEVIKKMSDWNKSSKKSSVKVACSQLDTNKIASEIVVEHLVEAVLKDKDLMRDTGGITKNRFKAPKSKPPRDDCRNRFKDRRKNKEQRDMENNEGNVDDKNGGN